MCSAPTGCTACGDRKGSRCRPTAINHVWAYDFVFDTCANGQTLKCLTIIDEFTASAPDRCRRWDSVRARHRNAHAARERPGAPRYLRSDNGPEFVARAILRWLQTAAIETAFIDPGKPWQNGADESFNGKFRDQHLSLQWFRNRLEAKVSIEAWRRHYNDVRPHSSLGYLTPGRVQSETSSKQCPALRCQNSRYLVDSKHGA
jgi:putative transposase